MLIYNASLYHDYMSQNHTSHISINEIYWFKGRMLMLLLGNISRTFLFIYLQLKWSNWQYSSRLSIQCQLWLALPSLWSRAGSHYIEVTCLNRVTDWLLFISPLIALVQVLSDTSARWRGRGTEEGSFQTRTTIPPLHSGKKQKKSSPPNYETIPTVYQHWL